MYLFSLYYLAYMKFPHRLNSPLTDINISNLAFCSCCLGKYEKLPPACADCGTLPLSTAQGASTLKESHVGAPSLFLF